jgi:enoyl-CoA hydratase
MPDYGRFNNLLVSVDDRVATLTLNRPQVLNAVNYEMHFELRNAFEDLGKDPNVNAIVVTGAGRGFCSGFDQKPDPNNPGMLVEDVGQVTRAILSTPQPIISAVNGHAVGQGSQIALFCDVVIASDRAVIGDVHVMAGVAAGDGGVAIFPQLTGLNKAKELLMTAGMMSGEEAYRLGIVQRLVPHDRLMDEAMGLARRLASGPQLAIRWTKQLLNKAAWGQAVGTLNYTSALELLSGQAPDRHKGAEVFGKKRAP